MTGRRGSASTAPRASAPTSGCRSTRTRAAAAETAACPPEEGEDTSDGTARDGWGDDDDDDDDDAQGDDGECDCDDEHEDDHDDCDDDEDDNRVCTDQCGEVQGLLDACTAELGAGHEHCEELQEIADECAQNEPPADTGDTDAATSRIRALASCDVMHDREDAHRTQPRPRDGAASGTCPRDRSRASRHCR